MKPEYESSVLEILRSEGIVALADQFELGRYLSKLGSLDFDAEMLRFLAPRLTAAEVIALHAYLKGWGRSEEEWREQFEGIFAEHAHALPEFDPL